MCRVPHARVHTHAVLRARRSSARRGRGQKARAKPQTQKATDALQPAQRDSAKRRRRAGAREAARGRRGELVGRRREHDGRAQAGIRADDQGGAAPLLTEWGGRVEKSDALERLLAYIKRRRVPPTASQQAHVEALASLCRRTLLWARLNSSFCCACEMACCHRQRSHTQWRMCWRLQRLTARWLRLSLYWARCNLHKYALRFVVQWRVAAGTALLVASSSYGVLRLHAKGACDGGIWANCAAAWLTQWHATSGTIVHVAPLSNGVPQ